MTLLPGARELLAVARARAAPARRPVRSVLRRAGAARRGHRRSTAGSRSTRTRWRWPPAASSPASRDAGTLPHGEARPARLPPGAPLDRGLATCRARPRPGCSTRSPSSRAGRSRRSPTAARGTPRTLGGLFDLASALERPVTLVAQLRHPPPVGRAPERRPAARLSARRRARRPAARTGTSATSPAWSAACAGRAAACTASPTPTPRWATRGVHLQPQERLAAALERRDMPAGGMIVVVVAPRTPGGARRRRRARAARGHLGQRHRHRRSPLRREREPSWSRSSAATSARSCAGARCSRPSSASTCDAGVGWTPANQALTPLGPRRRAQPVRLDRRPAPAARRRHPRARRRRRRGESALELDAVRHRRDRRRSPGSAARGASCARPARARGASSARARAGELRARVPARCGDAPARRCRSRWRRSGAPSRSPREVMAALVEAGVEPERFFAEYAPAPVRDSGRARRGDRERRPQRGAPGGRARDRAPAGHARELRAAARPRAGGQRRAHPPQPARRARAPAAATTPRARRA